MSEFTTWSETKAEASRIDPSWDAPDRVAARDAGREQLRAEIRGAQLAEMRKRQGVSQRVLAARLGITQARVSQIEHGKVSGMDTVRAYVIALGGTLDVVADFGDHTIKVA